MIFVQGLDIDVFEACGGSADKTNRGACEQFGSHFGFGANDQRVGIFQVFWPNRAVGDDLDLAERFKRFAT